MAIKILTASVRPDRKSTSVGPIKVETGAANYFNTLAQFGSTANDAVSSYFTQKAKNELELKKTTSEASLDLSMNELSKRLLDPAGEFANSPDTWEQSFQDGAKQILENELSGVSNSILKSSIVSSFNTKYLGYEKNIVKSANAKVSNLLSAQYRTDIDTAADKLKVVDNVDDAVPLFDAIEYRISQLAAGGHLKPGETIDSIVTEKIGEIMQARILTTAEGMTLSEMQTAFKTRNFNDPLVDEFMARVSAEDMEVIYQEATDLKKQSIEKIINLEDQAEKYFEILHEDKILAMSEEPDATKRQAAYEDLMVTAGGDKQLENIINTAFYKDRYSQFDQIDKGKTRIAIQLGEYSLNDLMADKQQFTETTFLELQDLWATNNRPQSSLVNNIRNEIKTMFFYDDDKTTKTDDKLAQAFDTQQDLAIQKFNKLIRDPEISPQEAYSQIIKESEITIAEEVFKLFSEEVTKANSVYVRNKLFVNAKTFYNDIEYYRTRIPESMKRSFETYTNRLINTYGDYIPPATESSPRS